MKMIDQLDRLKVNEVFHESIKRPFLFVYPDSKLLEVATFLAIGPEIYVDGLVVAVELNRDGKKIRTPIGRVGGRNVLSSIIDPSFSHQKDFFLHVTASQIMTETVESECVELDSPLSKVIDIFRRTRFGFVPIIQPERVGNNNNNKPVILGTLALRDFLPLIVNKKIGNSDDENEKVATNQISSPLVSVDKNTTIRKAISIMINKGIRNIGVENCDRDCRHNNNNNKEKTREKNQGSKLLRIVNDRKIMEFLLSHKSRETPNISFGIVSDLDMIQLHETRNDITVREAAQYLMNIKKPCLLLEGKNRIITPWDLVMRAIGKTD